MLYLVEFCVFIVFFFFSVFIVFFSVKKMLLAVLNKRFLLHVIFITYKVLQVVNQFVTQ